MAGITDSRVRRPASLPQPGAFGVVHLGLGAFHRAHQALVFDSLREQGDPRWGVLGVAMRSSQWADAIAAQDGLYSVRVSSAEATHWRVVASVVDTCVAAREPERVLDAIASPSTRWVTLTVTEKGYTPALADLVVRGLERRLARGLPGLTIASCDNLAGNGDRLAALCRQATASQPLRDWMEHRCAFPNSMVDRIVPAATPHCREQAAQALGVTDEAALATEAFWEWAIEDRFVDPADAAALRSVGVTVVADVRPFETAKLRLLNGSHSALACIGAVLGRETVADCVADPALLAFLHRWMSHEVMPHLERPGLGAYRDALLARFANPALQHRVHQIATDFSQKIPQRWVPSVRVRLDQHLPFDRLAFVAAMWVRYCLGETVDGVPYALTDPLAERLHAAARTHRDDDAGSVRALLAIASIWDDELPQHPEWLARVTDWLGAVRARGVNAVLGELAAAD